MIVIKARDQGFEELLPALECISSSSPASQISEVMAAYRMAETSQRLLQEGAYI